MSPGHDERDPAQGAVHVAETTNSPEMTPRADNGHEPRGYLDDLCRAVEDLRAAFEALCRALRWEQ